MKVVNSKKKLCLGIDVVEAEDEEVGIRFYGFIYLDYLKVFNHFFGQKAFRQLYVRILFYCTSFSDAKVSAVDS